MFNFNQKYEKVDISDNDERAIDGIANTIIRTYAEREGYALTALLLFKLMLDYTSVKEMELKSLKEYFQGREHKKIYDYIQSSDGKYYFSDI